MRYPMTYVHYLVGIIVSFPLEGFSARPDPECFRWLAVEETLYVLFLSPRIVCVILSICDCVPLVLHT